jgi:hypothetical protein
MGMPDTGDLRRRGRAPRRGIALAAVAACVALPAGALAHVERPSYWPDPAPDTDVSPPAGGKVPEARSLASALDPGARGQTRVVCQASSLDRALRSIAKVETDGYKLRPTQPREHLSADEADRLRSLNRRFFDACNYHQIQPAVFDSGNNDRIVIMPGVYREPHSRAQPTFDPKCEKYLTDTDHGSGPIGLSYRYQWKCPNDQALVNVLGRRPDPDPPPPPLPDRHGIPDLGPCVLCNLQMEGSGARPEDVVIEAGDASAGNGGPSGVGSKKDVALKVDRADGFVLRNVTIRHAIEHDIYVLETDGYLLDRVKFFYAGEYGHLTFADDHGLTQNCEAVGNGDSAVYPGGAPDTGEQTIEGKQRLNQEIRFCDLHHNNLGYSGTMGNATYVHHNNFYDNTTGIATDSFYAGGHPGYPEDSAVFTHNNIYSNNFNDYAEGSDVTSTVGVPLGTGIIIGGGNNNLISHNRIYDNWRRGTMLVAVPDIISCMPGEQYCQAENVASTSFDNKTYANTVGVGPGGKEMPNGVDFWWDEFPTNTGNCWHDNIGPDGTDASWTGDPPRFPTPGLSIPTFLPELCRAQTNIGVGDPLKEVVLLYCAVAAIGDPNCEWYTDPGKPGSAKAKAYNKETKADAQRMLAGSQLTSPSCNLVGGMGGTLTCAAFEGRP